MKIRDLFNDKKDAGVQVTLGNASLPLDLVLEMVIRQQNQLYSENAAMRMRLEVIDQVHEQFDDNLKHIHDDFVQLRQVLEMAAKHPVEKVDDQTEEAEREPKKDLIH